MFKASAVYFIFLRLLFGTSNLTQIIIKMENTVKKMILFAVLTVLFVSCTNENLTPIYGEQQPGKVVIKSYDAMEKDSVQLVVNGVVKKIGKNTAFIKKIVDNYEFVFYEKKVENIEVFNKTTGKIIGNYSFKTDKPIDTLSFYYNDGIWLDKVIANKPGKLTTTNHTGYRFVFPTMNRFSNSGYNGAIDAIIRNYGGQVVGVAENITKERYSNYVEFLYSTPSVLNVELVKHGTKESYITGKPIIIQIGMQRNKSKIIVLDEKADANGVFTKVEGIINLPDLFDY